MSSIGSKRVDEYINNVCNLIKNKKVHENIKDELLSHIDEIVDDCIDEGKSKDEAINQALIQMGDYNIVGTNLNKVHKATVDWALLIMTSIFIAFGIFTLGFMEKNNVLEGYSSSSFLAKTIIFSIVGSIIAYGLLKMDYRSIKKYSKYIYAGAIVVSLLGLFASNPVNGIKGWIAIGQISFNTSHIAPLLFIISLAGIFENYDWSNMKMTLIGLALAIGPCLFLILLPSLPTTIIYSISVTTLMIISGVKLKNIIIFISTFGVASIVYFLSEPYRIDRLLALINPLKDTYGNGWIYNQLIDLRNSAGLFGQGEGITLGILPEANTDFIFTYIIYSFGWVTAIILVSLVLAFIIRIGFISVNARDRYGKLIASGLCALFASQFLLSILVNLNLFPSLPISMPFISYSGTGIIINMFAIGIITSVHKWRNTPFVKVETI